MKKTTKVLSLAASVVLVSACSNNKKTPIEAQERKRAPASQEQVGLVVENSNRDQIENLLGAHPEATVRVLNEKHGMFEIYGVGSEEVSKFVTSTVHANQFIRLQNRQNLEAKHQVFSVAAPEGLEVPGLNRCKTGATGPNAKISLLEPALAIDGATIDIGQTLKFRSDKSVGHVKTSFAVLGPELGATPEKIIPGAELDLNPDAMGIYRVIVVVQDANDVCAMDGVSFLVTANRPYTGVPAADAHIDLSIFRHLKAVSAQEAWAIGEGEGVSIAVVDSGLNYNHPLIAANVAINTAEIDGNDSDDDANGFKDDVLGYDFVNQDPFPFDDDGHGTHVAGLAAGRQFGIARKAKIIAIKAMTAVGGDVGTIASAVRYAADRGAKIINLSLGVVAPLPHPLMVSAVNYAEAKGALLIIAAGNGDPQTGLGFSIDEITVFPASLPNDAILSVGAFDAFDELSSYSNFGIRGVDVVAPGGALPMDPMISLATENAKGNILAGMNGTSMASPIAAGIAALVLGKNPALTAAQLKQILIATGPQKPALQKVIASGRHLNALAAISAQ